MRCRRAGTLVAIVLVTMAAGGACASSHGPVSRSAAPLLVTGSPAASSTLASREVARIRIANPDGMTEVAGQIWVKTDDGRVVRVDPSRNKVIGSIQVDTAAEPQHYCQGIGTDGTDVWSCAASDTTTGLVRIDPTHPKPGKPAAVDKIFDQLTLPYTTRGFWVLSGDGRSLSVVAPSSGAVTRYALPARCLQLAASDAVVIATCASENLVLAIEPSTGQVRGRVSLPEPRLAVVTDRDIWVDTSKGLTRLALDLTVRSIFPNQYAGLDGDLAVSGNDLWVRGRGGVLWRIDQARNEVAEHITSDTQISAGSLLVTAGAIWTTQGDEGYLVRLSLG
jgi:hypothetical protein